jgi:hypothetical protein
VLSWIERAVLAEAVVFLALARAAVITLPFGVIARRLGSRMEDSDFQDDPDSAPIIHRVMWAIGAASRRAPWRCKCLEQAIAASAMLRWRRIQSTMYLGVTRADGDTSAPTTGGDPSGIHAHAWVRSGSVHVTGGRHVGAYTVVAKFAWTPTP